MRIGRVSWLLVTAALALAGPARAALPPLHAVRGADARIADSGGRQVLLRGVNVNQLGDYYRGSPALDPTVPLTAADFDEIARLGFDSVRLLVHWSALEPTPGAFDPAYVARIHQAVDWARARGIYTVIDMHQDAWSKYVGTPAGEVCAPGFSPAIGWDGAPAWATFTDGLPTCAANGVRELSPAVAEAWQSFYDDRDGIQGRLVATWGRLAHEFANEPSVAGFDILNEPNPGFAPSASAASELAAFYARALTAIRAGEHGGIRHLAFFEPLVVWSATAVDAVPPPTFTSDSDIVFAPHLYAGSITVDRAAGTPFLTPRDGHAFAASAASGYGTTYWSGEWGWFGDPAADRPDIASYAAEEDARRVGGAWWDWKQACGDPHQFHDAAGGGTSPSLNRYACPEQRALGIPEGTRRILARGYPRAAPGRLTAVESDPESGSLQMAGVAGGSGDCGLDVWVPGDHGMPRPAGVNVTRLTVVPSAGGWRVRGCARGSYELRTAAFVPAVPARRCLPAGTSVRRAGVGPVSLGVTRARVLSRAGVRPLRTGPLAYAWCVSGAAGRVTAIFSARARAATAAVVASTATTHQTRMVGRGSSRRLLLRRFPLARRIRPGLYRAGPRSRRVFGVSRGRVRFAAVAERRLIARPALLARMLSRAGV